MTLIYENREGQRWVVRECVAHPLVPGFWLGMRASDGATVCVHEHRVRSQKTEDRSQKSEVRGQQVEGGDAS